MLPKQSTQSKLLTVIWPIKAGELLINQTPCRVQLKWVSRRVCVREESENIPLYAGPCLWAEGERSGGEGWEGEEVQRITGPAGRKGGRRRRRRRRRTQLKKWRAREREKERVEHRTDDKLWLINVVQDSGVEGLLLIERIRVAVQLNLHTVTLHQAP